MKKSNVKINKSLVMIAVSAISSAANAGVEVNIDTKHLNKTTISNALAALNKAEPTIEIGKGFELLSNNLRVDGKLLDIQIAADRDSSTIGNTGSCYANCYSNCHSACHGSRGWR